MRVRSFSLLALSLAASTALACGASRWPAKTAPTGGAYAPRDEVAYEAPPPANTEHYTDYGVNPFVDAAQDKLSTFAIDVDTASYSIARRKLREGGPLPKEAVRVEEFVNSFEYGYAPPAQGTTPFAVHLAAAPSPFTQGAHLVRIGIKGKQVQGQERAPVHLVYLVDTSGSMDSPDKLGLAKKSLHMLTDSLKPGDTVALCTYAGDTREVLAPTGIDRKAEIHAAIEQLTSGGGTAMSSGIDTAYALAKRTQVKGHVNRVIVLSDGDANIGPASHEEILRRIEQYKQEGITLSTVGLGNGNYQDTMMEQLADKGDGNYSYVDDEKQAKKVFVEQIDGLLQVIARDVKVQVELDPEVVEKYRLIGYENRDVKDKDFKNDKVDGGEIGAGHGVTALYEIVLKKTDASPLKVAIRYKKPLGSDPATETSYAMDPSQIAKSFDETPASFRLAAAVAGFAEILRKSPWAKDWSLEKVEAIAKGAAIVPSEQSELLELIGRAKQVQ